MVIVDASVWICHLRQAEPRLLELIEQGRLLMHPFIVGEIALGSLARRDATVDLLRDLAEAPVVTLGEVLLLIERENLHGLGIGYVDAHLLASARLADATLWTRDKRLDRAADRLGVRAGFERRH